MITLYPPSSRFAEEDVKTPASVLRKMLKLFVISLHWYQAKLKGPDPPGLVTFRVPFWEPDALQKIKTGSLTPGADGYEVYLIALLPGAEN